MARYRVSNAARADLEDIGRYTQKTWGKAQRIDYLNGLETRFDALSKTPTLNAERKDFKPPVRIQQHQKHLIIYLIDDLGILIVRVLHERMNVSALLSS